MWAEICRMILATDLLTCGPPIKHQDIAQQALEHAASTAATGVSAPFIIWRDLGDCLASVTFALDVSARDAVTVDVEKLRVGVAVGDRTPVCTN